MEQKHSSVKRPSSFFRKIEEIDPNYTASFLKISEEIKGQLAKKGISLTIEDNTLELSGSNYAFYGLLSQHLEQPLRVRVKISSSPKKFLDMERELYVLDQIKRLDYPTPQVLHFGETSTGHLFTIQEYIEGKQVRKMPKSKQFGILPELQNFFVDLHSKIEIPGYGRIFNFDGKWRGESKNWPQALMKKAKRSLNRSRTMDVLEDEKLTLKLAKIIKKHHGLLDIKYASLLHGDAGLINFLGNEGKLAAILDPEYAVRGDPAYEFSDNVGEDRDYPREFILEYIDKMKKRGIDLRKETFFIRSVIYLPFILIDVIPNLWEAGNIEGAKYFISTLQDEIERALSIN